MIQPLPRNDVRRQRLVAVFATLVLMVGLQAGLRSTPVPVLTSAAAVIRKLNPVFVERFAAPRPAPAPGRADDAAPRLEGAGSARSLDGDVASVIDDLSRRLTAPSTVPAGGPAGARLSDRAALERDGDAPLLRDLFSGAAVVGGAPLPRVGPATTRRTTVSGELELAPRSSPRAPPSANRAGPAVAVEASGNRDRLTATRVVIAEHASESFGGSEAEMLGRWMAAHPAELPVGVKVHLNHRAPFQTAVVPVESEGRHLELFLMFNRSLQELHILLVEGDRSVYLIDRGFRAQSRSLREGTVRRLDGAIVAVDSRPEAASSDLAREFYNIFLSWWQAARRGTDR